MQDLLVKKITKDTEDNIKTILIPIFHPLDARNILQTQIFLELKKRKNLKIVLVVPEAKLAYYRDNFSEGNVVVQPSLPVKENRLLLTLYLGARSMFYSGSIYWQNRIYLTNTGRWLNYFFYRFLSNLGRFKIIRNCWRNIFNFFYRANFFEEIIKKYNPDLIFLTDIYNKENIYLGLEARNMNKKVWGMVRSWDNITSKGVALFIPDKIIVHNKELKKQAIRILNINPQDIFVSGLPHFDYYKNYTPTNRESFLQKLNLPPGSRYILFAPYWGTYTKGVNEVLQIMDKAILKKKLPEDLKIVVRMPPSYNIGFVEVWSSPRIFIDYPGKKISHTGKSDWVFTLEDMVHLADSIFHASVVINFASTITIDAAAFDRPIINLGFDGYNKKPFSYSISEIYIVDHFRKIISNKGSQIPKNIAEFLSTINNYLINPNLDQKERQILVEEQCGKLDGQAGVRLANLLLAELNVK